MLLFVVGLLFFSGVRVVRPTSRGLVERLGKYHRLATPGFNWIIPGVDRMILVNITEVMVNAEPQEIITSDKLNARVDAQVYFKVKSDEESVKSSQYSVFDYQYQMVNLARTTLRNITPSAPSGMTLENSLSANTKFVLPSNGELVNVIGDMAGVLPLSRLPSSSRSSRPLSATADASPRSLGGSNGQ